MTAKVKKVVAAGADDPHEHEDITIQRRSRVPPAARPSLSRLTAPMGIIDPRLLAIARGEVEPESRRSSRPVAPTRVARPLAAAPAALPESSADYDPFGGLIPVEDEAVREDVAGDPQVLAERAQRPSGPREPIAYGGVLCLCLRPDQVVMLPIDPRSGFLLSLVDGQKTVEELIDVSHLSVTDTLDLLDELLWLGAITVV